MERHGTKLYSGSLAGLAIAAALLLPSSPEVDGIQQSPDCITSAMPLEGRASPLDSAAVTLHGATIKVCYGRPSARGRTMIGGDDVPFGRLWRTGANEPTMIHATAPIRFGSLALEPGSYSFYTIPGETEWEIFVTRSTDHWGLQITEEVRSQELGSFTVPRERPDEHVETFTIRFGPASGSTVPLVMEWEHFRVTVPVEVVQE